MIPKECKRLAEVDFPIAAVGAHALAEKARRMGTPHQLHLWWAGRPLASSRAVLLGLLLPDPCDALCPAGFNTQARRLLSVVQGRPGEGENELRLALLRFIGDFSSWGLAGNSSYLEVARGLIRAAHGDEAPLVVDPFAGGGSIPLEALRLNCEPFGSDLNPVACLILKAKLEAIQRHGPKLVEDLRRVGAESRRMAEKELRDLYPQDPDGAIPIAYLWARTVRCESPKCGAEIPLVRSFWLCRKANRRRALRHSVERPKGEPPRVAFKVFEPKTDSDVPTGTATGAKATCVCCGIVLPRDRVREQLEAQRGGADTIFDAKARRSGGALLLAVVTLRAGETGRYYRPANERDYEPVRRSQARIAGLLDEWERAGRPGLCPLPDEPLPPIGTLGFRVQRYGMLRWSDLFTARQKLGFATLCRQTASSAEPQTLRELISMVWTKLADRCNGLVNWSVGVECPNQLFKGNAVPMAWDFAESNLLSDSSASIYQSFENLIDNAAATYIPGANAGTCQLADARAYPLSDTAAAIWFTDPPYYDAVPYSDLSDFFFVWFKRALPDHSLLRDPFAALNPLTPKREEAVQDETKRDNGRIKDRRWFEDAMASAFAEGRRVLKEDGIAAVVFAHKTTEGWEALLSGMIRGRWTITGSWPIATERSARMRARESAALATSVHLICRPRADDTPVGDWVTVLRELPGRVADWMERLQHEGVRGADLVFACIGPALGIFSRYERVETADGREVKLDEYLAKVWEVVGRAALAQILGTAEAKARNGAAGAVEEDARLTALFLWTLQATDGEGLEDAGAEEESEDAGDGDDDEEGNSGGKAKGFALLFDVVRRFAQPLGIDLPKWQGRVIEMKKGVVRLLPIAERAKQLFGEDGAAAVATRLEQASVLGNNPLQGMLFPEMEATPQVRGLRARGRRPGTDVSDEGLASAREATTLDRVHASMLLQSSGRTNALRALLKAEQDRGQEFLRLANALSALYPKGSEEKRLLDAMLLAVPR